MIVTAIIGISPWSIRAMTGYSVRAKVSKPFLHFPAAAPSSAGFMSAAARPVLANPGCEATGAASSSIRSP
jgi:hypothetical protein